MPKLKREIWCRHSDAAGAFPKRGMRFLLGLARSFPDTVSTVMRKRRPKASPKPSAAAALAHNLAATRPGVVNNSVPGQNGRDSFASGPARSRASPLHESSREITGRPGGLESKSLRELHPARILYQVDAGRTEAKARAAQPSSKTPDQKVPMATPEASFAHFASVDWAKQKHHAVILNPAGQIVAAFDFEHTAAGWQYWREQAARYAPLAVAIESESRPRHRPTTANARLHHLSA
jgi:hypothetical protein